MTTTLEPIANIPQYIFGEGSYQSTQESLLSCGASRYNNLEGFWFAAAALAVALIYLAWINHWSVQGKNHLKLFRFLGTHRGDYNSKLELFSPSFITYLRTGSLVGVLVFLVGLLSSIYSLGVVLPLDSWQLMGGVVGGVVALYLYQLLAIRAIGHVVQGVQFAQALLYIKAISLNIFAMVITPTILCWTISRSSLQEIVLYIVLIQIGTVLILFLYESFLLFIEKKVSLLHTILYLCAVEIFPITLVWGFFCR